MLPGDLPCSHWTPPLLAVLPAELDGCHLFLLGPGRPSNRPVCTSGRLFRHLSCSLALRSQRLTWPLALCMGARGASTDSLPEPADQVQTFLSTRPSPHKQPFDSLSSGWQLLCWDLPLQTVPPVPPHPAPPASNPSASLCWVLGSFSPDSLHCYFPCLWVSYPWFLSPCSILKTCFLPEFSDFFVCFFVGFLLLGGLYLSLEFYKTVGFFSWI